jgi:hypothetical protein
MNAPLGRFAFAIIAPLFLFGCLLTPGKFVSGLVINADRSFTFTYEGEVIAIDMANEMAGAMKDSAESIDDPAQEKLNLAPKNAKEPGTDDMAADQKKSTAAETERARKAIAEALTKEAGYRSAVYLGNGKFAIDYQISGVLTHNFLFPYNSDAEIIFPFISIELRAGKTVRVRAPGYANGSSASNSSGMGTATKDASKYLDGTFTLDTDAEIVSQNEESGATKSGGRSVITWKSTPLTKDAPNAVLRFPN